MASDLVSRLREGRLVREGKTFMANGIESHSGDIREMAHPDALEAADTIERYEAAGWQPISTAPKDGTAFDAWCEHGAGHRIHNVVWEKRYDAFFSDEDGILGSDLSHWMPLPLAPDALRSQDKGEG